MPLAIFRGAKAQIIEQALKQRVRITVGEQTAAGAVAADVIRVDGFLGAVRGDSSTGRVEVLAVSYRDVWEGHTVGERFGLVAAELVDGRQDFLCSAGG